VALRDVLVVLDASAQSAARLALAASLALRHGAELIGLCPHGLLALSEAREAPSGYPLPSGVQGIAGLSVESAAPPPAGGPDPNSPAEQAERIGEAFREALALHGLAGAYETAVGPPAVAVIKRARTADLVVLGQPDPDDPLAPAFRHVIEDVLMAGGRPVLLIPYAGHFATLGANVLLGWTETREATRAAHDALAVLDAGAKLTILTVRHGAEPEGRSELPAAAPARHLARHGFETRAAEAIAEGITPPSYVVRPSTAEADVLLNYASDIGADLLVVGAYGHSRARELVLGGVTRALLSYMTLPVLMSH
jgi:nucleotide-binding universal stress UspA family protein